MSWALDTGSRVLFAVGCERSLPSGIGQRALGAGANSKVVTGAPSYALAWPFPDPVHICALDAGRWVLELGAVAGALELGAVYVSWALQKRVKWRPVHLLVRWLGRFLSPCVLVPPFAMFAGLAQPWSASAVGCSSKE